MFQQNHLRLHVGQKADPQEIVRGLVDLQYRRTTGEISRGDVRLRGEVLDVWMPSRDDPLRVRFGWEGIERIKSARQSRGNPSMTSKRLGSIPGSST